MTEVWNQLKASVGDKLLEFGVRLLMAALLLLIGCWLIRRIRKWIHNEHFLKAISPSARSFLYSFSGILLKSLLAVLVIAALGVPMASIVAVIGSVGLAIGLALQGSLQNIAGGLIIMIFKPFALGDYVTIGDYAGTVTELGVFYTELTAPDNRRILVPNAEMSNKTTVNSVSDSIRRIDVEVGAPYSVKAEDVLAALQYAIAKVPELRSDPTPLTVCSGYADSAVLYQAQAWCDSEVLLKARYALNESIKRTFDERGISFPFPQLDVHIKEEKRAE